MKPTDAAKLEDILDKIKAARRVSTPLIAIATADPSDTLNRVREVFENGAKSPIPIVRWDVLNGLVALNRSGKAALASILKTDRVEEWPGLTANPGAALAMIAEMPGEVKGGPDNVITQRGSIVFMMNGHRFFEDRAGSDNAQVIQGIWNLRDMYKSNRRTLVILGPAFAFPPEIARDVIEFVEPLPTDQALADIVREQAAAVNPDEKTVAAAVNAVRALPAFTAEQIVAMSVGARSLDVDGLWERKISEIEKVPGISVDRGDEEFDAVGGLAQFKKFGLQLINGPRCPILFVRLDEFDKMLGGAGTKGLGDSSGVAQDAYGVILRKMEDNNWPGLIALGPAGTGKSHVTKSLAKTASKVLGRRVLSVCIDLGAAKGSLVGESERKIRAIMQAIEALAGKGTVCFVATVNEIDIMPAPLRRRFRYGIWYFDLPSEEEKLAVWAINAKKYGLEKYIAAGDKPDDTDWTPAEIRNVCELAVALGCSLTTAAEYIVPVAKSDPAGVDRLRRMADGRFLSASYAGAYKAPGYLSDKYVDSAPRGRAGAAEEGV